MKSVNQPLAQILRPTSLDDVIGQEHLVGPGMPLRKMAERRALQSMVIWGPPGTGKTTLGQCLAKDTDSRFYALNATEATVKDIRKIIDEAEKIKATTKTCVFVDEIHRWNKAQQDVVLPVVENGTIILIGATTERPKFAVNSTIISRSVILETKPLDTACSVKVVKRVLDYYRSQGHKIKIENDAAKKLINMCSGDARKIITTMETAIEVLMDGDVVTLANIDTAIPDKHLVFDARGNDHFDLAHCYQEAIQNSDPDAAIYWLAKWLASGEDPAFICRRMMITAAEDCAGNPNAWLAATMATFTTERTGLPECMIPMALATCEMAASKRNKAAYLAIKSAMSDVENGVTIHVPEGLRAGSHGYVAAVSRQYLYNWRKDNSSLDEHYHNDDHYGFDSE